MCNTQKYSRSYQKKRSMPTKNTSAEMKCDEKGELGNKFILPFFKASILFATCVCIRQPN